jgi:hypothetical protein
MYFLSENGMDKFTAVPVRSGLNFELIMGNHLKTSTFQWGEYFRVVASS